MQPTTLPIYNLQGQEIDSIKLDNDVFDGTINHAAIYQAVNAFRARQRRGLAATKTRGEVSGGGRKPWRQKGTGRSRHGSIRSPLWRHGGVIFGPHPRDFSFGVPRKIKQLALKSSLNAKVKENNLMVLDEFKVGQPKTKDAVKVFSLLKLESRKVTPNSVLLLLDSIERKERLALRNIGFLDFNLARETYAYQVVLARKLLITKTGLKQLIERLKR
jgi:large subunit ribosomal protein L4